MEAKTLWWIVVIVGGFLLGGILFCRLIPLKLKRIDICAASDDGNPGAANVFKLCGWPLGLFCLVLDMLKGFLPVFLTLKYLDSSSPAFVLVLLAPALGHAFPLWGSRRGGKCIATIFGELIALLVVSPAGWILAALYIFFSVAWRIRPHRRRSIVTFGLFALVSGAYECYRKRYAIAVGCTLLSGLAILKHLMAADAPAAAPAAAPERAAGRKIE